MLIGARLVSARSARTVTKVPLAEALRDREGSPYGRTAWQRLLARLRLGGLSTRLATRAGAHHPGRTLALVAEVAAAVGAAFLIASLATSVNAYNDASRAPWSWASQTVADDAGLPLPTDVAASDPDAETGIWTWGEIGDWQVDVYGLDPATRFFDPMLADGRWIEAGARDVVVSAGFAERTGIAVGEALEVDLATGPETYRVSGIADDHARTLYLDRAVLADDLGQPGQANVVWSSDDEPAAALPVAATTTTAAELAEEDGAGRQAIIVIFGTIGAVVAGVAALAVTSSMTVSLYRRRHELATMQALGARRRTVRGVVVRELLPIGLVGLVLGLGLGALGTQGVIASFESSNAVDIGVVNAVGSIPVIAAATVIGLVVLAWAVVRTAARRPIAVTLRGAA
jgi:putative ABC transport system permease protein